MGFRIPPLHVHTHSHVGHLFVVEGQPLRSSSAYLGITVAISPFVLTLTSEYMHENKH